MLGRISERLYEKRVDPFARAQSPSLTKGIEASGNKIGREIGWASRGVYMEKCMYNSVNILL